ncbi:SMC-Scp complex subunit ScpB [Xinfangfangia sp. D13-10-4-6]|uniref:SMC-Scp complex subunit ScpB n=1 Tax=Pseudogemmobacter hezensis TaxID=2737662 RepID=UPI0015557A86|nr:SMC-Scp complex subunit ScpB [Pseudogemmobacter hezensis]NPD15983.1 SMC-Scp complex subunit ScpB [Pseudogemmobacter hezensis]
MAADRFDPELPDLPQAMRWREWMARAEAVIFASPTPVTREVLARVVGQGVSLDLLIEDVANSLQDRPYEIARVAAGWQMRTRSRFAPAIRAALAPADSSRNLTPGEALILTAVAYLQPVTRGAISRMTGREVSRDTVARLFRQGLIGRGPRSPEPGAPYTWVTTQGFLEHFGFASLRDLPDIEAMEDAGLLSRDPVPSIDLPVAPEED